MTNNKIIFMCLDDSISIAKLQLNLHIILDLIDRKLHKITVLYSLIHNN